jgi:hypothetical protein
VAGFASSIELQAGDTVDGRYTVVSPISSGAMGAVYRARDPDGREVAIKRLLDLRQAARFDIEARLLSRLRHPRVVAVLEHFQDDSGKYLVMDLVAGEDLGETLGRRGRPGLPVGEALSHARHVCEALHYVHEQGIIHRDVKPQNLILAEHGPVLVDFGIARELTDPGAGTRAIGTPLYMAPEVLVGEAVSPRSDVYSLAATIWALVTGRPPTYHDRRSLAQIAPGVSPEVERTLSHALEPRAERRIASVQALAAALGSRLGASDGLSLARSITRADAERSLLESIVRTAAGVFEAAAASIALHDSATGELVYHAAWGAGAEEIVGVRLQAGVGIAGAVVAGGESITVPNCREDERFAAQVAAGTGYVPHTLMVIPLVHDGSVKGVLSILDRRSGRPYLPADLPRAELFAELTVTALPAAAALTG